ncbi:hypothetical protein NP233_g6659 [Leucocoprinus birnbaumii]|uniref:Uncharacterized protein n=1 Tax=Leucocoprinus birnbaumii TaxID=56174 RepID=A0AAD5VQP8_9AGAR|nr:hypothetical protein NP233_g6659 [Leucocoprinus birnbaumii]
MSASRNNTIYDFTSLRLHPDGSRVSQSSERNLDAVSGSVRNRKSKVFSKRRGWVAGDAGGALMGSCVLKRGRGGIVRGVEGEKEHGGEEEERGRTMKRKVRHVDAVKTKRAKKRLRFEDDETFIAPDESQPIHQENEQNGLPSSDLLKAIHQHTSDFYRARGTLYPPNKHQREIAKRKEREREKLKKEQRIEEAGYLRTLIKRRGRAQLPESSDEEDTTPLPKQQQQDDDDDDDTEVPESPISPPTSPVIETPTSPTGAKRNMYRVFDGSFLLGLGILAQEKTAELLEAKVPQEVQDGEMEGGEGGDIGKVYPKPYFDGNDGQLGRLFDLNSFDRISPGTIEGSDRAQEFGGRSSESEMEYDDFAEDEQSEEEENISAFTSDEADELDADRY